MRTSEEIDARVQVQGNVLVPREKIASSSRERKPPKRSAELSDALSNVDVDATRSLRGCRVLRRSSMCGLERGNSGGDKRTTAGGSQGRIRLGRWRVECSSDLSDEILCRMSVSI